MYEIIPGILEKDWQTIEQKILQVKNFAKTIHIDIADGKLVPNTTFLDPLPFKKYSSSIFFELHMMVEQPLQYLKPFADAGFKRFYGHIEKMSDQAEFIRQGQLLGEVGFAFDGPTQLDRINISLKNIDCFLFYTSEKAGFSGPPFVPDRLEKVKQIRVKTQVPIEVDGGINATTIISAKNAGANRFVSTSFLFSNIDPQKQFELLSKSCVG